MADRTSKTVVYPTPWRLESRNEPIADTGDYDGVITIKSADGKTITEAWNPSDDDVVAFQRIIDVMNAHDSPGVHCVHCNGKGVETQHYDEETGWSDPDVPCATCGGSGRIRTVKQYLKTVPANWHEDSSVRTWFPLLDEEVARLRRAEARCNEHHAEMRLVETTDRIEAPHSGFCAVVRGGRCDCGTDALNGKSPPPPFEPIIQCDTTTARIQKLIEMDAVPSYIVRALLHERDSWRENYWMRMEQIATTENRERPLPAAVPIEANRPASSPEEPTEVHAEPPPSADITMVGASEAIQTDSGSVNKQGVPVAGLANSLPGNLTLHPDFGDPETLFNSRQWLRKALESNGAKQIGAGCGGGQADIDILLEGCKFNVSIKPIMPPEEPEETRRQRFADGVLNETDRLTRLNASESPLEPDGMPVCVRNPTLHSWSVRGRIGSPLPEKLCENGCGLMWKNRLSENGES